MPKSFQPHLELGQILNNSQLTAVFKCGTQGGMRRSRATNSLVIISDHTKPYYHDKWVGAIFHYTGMGIKGDQDIDFMQNKTLAQCQVNEVSVFLFEVNKPKEYIYKGVVTLAEKPYKANQKDVDGHLRCVWIFPLKLSEEFVTSPITLEEFEKKQLEQERAARRLPLAELREKAVEAAKNGLPKQRTVILSQYDRNLNVSAFVKELARGVCQLCKSPAPFRTTDGECYLEAHHIIWLSKGGRDIIQNSVALCPNCHRKIHVLNLSRDIETLISVVRNRESM